MSDSPAAYIAAMNEDPGGSPSDAVGTNWWECVIVPPSLRWFIHTLRSSESDSGHLWVPPEWEKQIGEAYPSAHPPQQCR
jgi:hypothetical protein